MYVQYSSNSVWSVLSDSHGGFAVGTEEKIPAACRLCDSIQLSVQSEKCLHFLEIIRLNRINHIASYVFSHPKSKATTCESTVVEIN